MGDKATEIITEHIATFSVGAMVGASIATGILFGIFSSAFLVFFSSRSRTSNIRIVVSGDQYRDCIDNVSINLCQNNVTWSNVKNVTVYVKDMNDEKEVRDLLQEYIQNTFVMVKQGKTSIQAEVSFQK